MPIMTCPVPSPTTLPLRPRAIVAVCAALILAGCGGGQGDHPPSKPPANAAPSPAIIPVELQESSVRCQTATTGTILGLEALLSARHHPALSGVRRMDLGRYCPCYFSGLQRAVGVERALSYTENPQAMGATDLVETATAADLVRVQCVEALGHAAGSDLFSGVFTAPFISGRGLGGVELGIPVEQLRARLGETNLITRGHSDKFRFGPNGIELVVDVFPSGAGGRVAGVRVNRFYRGATDRGIRMGDAYAEVEARHSDIVFRAEGRTLLAADGTKYVFNEGGFLSDIGVVTAETDGLMRNYGPH